LLYDVFLNEFGHTQVVRPGSRSDRRQFAGETLAQEFAEHWNRAQWSRESDHHDPVHNSPTATETMNLPQPVGEQYEFTDAVDSPPGSPSGRASLNLR
jgi:hypothetical protein